MRQIGQDLLAVPEPLLLVRQQALQREHQDRQSDIGKIHEQLRTAGFDAAPSQIQASAQEDGPQNHA